MAATRLAALRKPLEDMSPQELRALVSHIRADRKVSKESVTKRKEKAAISGKSRKKATALLDDLTAEELDQLLRELGDDKGRQLPSGPEGDGSPEPKGNGAGI